MADKEKQETPWARDIRTPEEIARRAKERYERLRRLRRGEDDA